jgi:DNA-binding Lrp family transcriptional regulator
LAASASPRGDALPRQGDFAGLRLIPNGALEARVVPFFVQIKCHLGKSYEVANKLADSEIASEIYSTAGDFDLLVKFYVEAGTDIGHFVNEKVQTIAGIQDTRTIITFKAF